MDEFVKELMEVTTHYGHYGSNIPEYEITELLKKHFNIILDPTKYHGPLHAYHKDKYAPLIAQVYGEVIVDQLRSESVLAKILSKEQ